VCVREGWRGCAVGSRWGQPAWQLAGAKDRQAPLWSRALQFQPGRGRGREGAGLGARCLGCCTHPPPRCSAPPPLKGPSTQPGCPAAAAALPCPALPCCLTCQGRAMAMILSPTQLLCSPGMAFRPFCLMGFSLAQKRPPAGGRGRVAVRLQPAAAPCGGVRWRPGAGARCWSWRRAQHAWRRSPLTFAHALHALLREERQRAGELVVLRRGHACSTGCGEGPGRRRRVGRHKQSPRAVLKQQGERRGAHRCRGRASTERCCSRIAARRSRASPRRRRGGDHRPGPRRTQSRPSQRALYASPDDLATAGVAVARRWGCDRMRAAVSLIYKRESTRCRTR
jgi:hypothetical protein